MRYGIFVFGKKHVYTHTYVLYIQYLASTYFVQFFGVEDAASWFLAGSVAGSNDAEAVLKGAAATPKCLE